jgi:hypothetical protein
MYYLIVALVLHMFDQLVKSLSLLELISQELRGSLLQVGLRKVQTGQILEGFGFVPKLKVVGLGLHKSHKVVVLGLYPNSLGFPI